VTWQTTIHQLFANNLAGTFDYMGRNPLTGPCHNNGTWLYWRAFNNLGLPVSTPLSNSGPRRSTPSLLLCLLFEDDVIE
jgi:hypothetical protein